MASTPHPLRQPFTQDETALFSSIFKQLDVEGLGIVTGDAARSTFEKSGLPPATLGEIWQLADPTNLGFLNQFAFSVALRLIGHVQSGAKPDKSLVDSAGQLPRFQGTTSSQPPAQQSQQPLSPQFTALPPLTNHDISKFAQLFNKSANNGSLTGEQARQIFLKAKLPTPVLGQIWGLVDTKNLGQLTRDEFIVAMFLIQGSLNNSVTTLPPTIPQQIWDQVSAFHSPIATGSSTTSSTQSPQITNSRPGSVSRIPSSFGNAANDWVISPQKKAQFDNIFDGLDKDSQGVLGPNEVAPFLMTSKLPQDILASIWDLSDIHNTGEFTKEEFAIAMFLVQKKIAGVELPHVIPESLLSGPQPEVRSQPTFQQQPSQQQAKQIPQIPSRDTKPKSSLNDLVDLNDAFTTPSPTIPDQRIPSNTSTSSVKYTPTGSRFVPTSTFGQSIAEQPQQFPAAAPAVSTPQASSVPASVEPEKKSTASYFAPQQTGTVPPATIQFPQPTGFAASAQQPAITSPTVVSPQVQSRNVIPSFSQNNDLLADSTSEISGQLSKTTTDLANLSNQIGSLTNQTSQLHEKRTRAERELAKMTALKNDIETKLSKLRVAYDQEVQQTSNVESLLITSRNETEQLRKESSVVEAQYNQVQSSLQNLQAELEESQKENSALKERLGTFNAEQIELQRQLENTSNDVKQSRGLIAINSKQLDVAQVQSSGIREEIASLLSSAKELDTHHESYTQKQLELESFKQQLEQSEQGLQSRQQQYEQLELNFQAKEDELRQRLEQQQQNELAIQQQEQRVQQLFENLQQRQAELSSAEAQLQQQQVDYAQRVQDHTYKQIQDATTGFSTVEDDDSVTESKETSRDLSSGDKESSNLGLLATAAAATGVAGIAGASIAGTSSKSDDGERDNTEFSSPLAATTEQGTSVTSEDYQYRTVNQFPHLDIERPDSATSSVQNNAPQSVRGEGDDIDDQVVDDQVTSEEQPALAADVLSKDYNPPSLRQSVSGGTPAVAVANDESSGAGSFEILDEDKSESGSTLRPPTGVIENKEVDAIETSIPGGWNVPTASPLVAAAETLPDSQYPDDVETPIEEDALKGYTSAKEPNAIPKTADEFPPIQHLQIDESDSEDDQFHETIDDLPIGTNTPTNGNFNFESTSRGVADNEFDDLQVAKENVDAEDDFAGLESAKEDRGEFDEFDGLQATTEDVSGFDDFDGLEQAPESNFEQFDDGQFTQQADFDEHFDGTTFFGAEEAQHQQHQQSQQPQQQTSGQEWEEVFAGFGNQNQTARHPTEVAQPVPQTQSFGGESTTSTPLRPKIATTPRSLAVQELTGMGFSKEEALAALEKEKWNLEAATNHLLDNA